MVNTPESGTRQTVAREYLTFRRMITPIIIQGLFWIGTAGFALLGVILIVMGMLAKFGGGSTVLIGILCLVLGPFYVRISCELLILFFKMHESLANIQKGLHTSKESAPMLA